MTIPAKTNIGSVSLANIIPLMLAPIIKTNEENQEEGTDANKANLSEEKLELLFSKLDLSGLDDWDQDLQKEAKDLIAEFNHLFALLTSTWERPL